MRTKKNEDPAAQRVRALGDKIIEVMVATTICTIFIMLAIAVAHKLWTS